MAQHDGSDDPLARFLAAESQEEALADDTPAEVARLADAEPNPECRRRSQERHALLMAVRGWREQMDRLTPIERLFFQIWAGPQHVAADGAGQRCLG
jgi:hypothetical protein